MSHIYYINILNTIKLKQIKKKEKHIAIKQKHKIYTRYKLLLLFKR